MLGALRRAAAGSELLEFPGVGLLDLVQLQVHPGT